jgi:hypothetical protein
MRDKLLTQLKGKQFDVNKTAIFGKFDLFCRRIEKLQDFFTTVVQLANLASHRVEGMEALMKTFQPLARGQVTHTSSLTQQMPLFDIKRDIRALFGSVEEMYSMLIRYEVRVTKEEQDTVGEQPYTWMKLKTLADNVGDGLVAVQSNFNHFFRLRGGAHGDLTSAHVRTLASPTTTEDYQMWAHGRHPLARVP